MSSGERLGTHGGDGQGEAASGESVREGLDVEVGEVGGAGGGKAQGGFGGVGGEVLSGGGLVVDLEREGGAF